MADQRAGGGEADCVRANSAARDQDRRGRLEAVEQQRQRGERPCSRCAARWSRRYCPSRCRGCRPCPPAGSAAARTGSSRADSRAPARRAGPRSMARCGSKSEPRPQHCADLRRVARHATAARWTPPRPSSSSIPASAGCRCWGRRARCCPTRRSSMPPTAPAFPTASAARRRSPRASRPCSAGWSSASSPRLAVIACNTASTIALDHARAALDLPVVGTVPAIKPAAELSKSRVIGVLGTEATVRQPYVDDLAARVRRRLHGHPPRLARAGRARRGQARRRSGRRRGRRRRGSRRCSTRPTASGSTSIVLACTHFPLLADELARGLPGMSPMSTAAPASRGASPI